MCLFVYQNTAFFINNSGEGKGQPEMEISLELCKINMTKVKVSIEVGAADRMKAEIFMTFMAKCN